MNITDQYLAQFTAAEVAAILSGFSAIGFSLRYSFDDACWLA
jgi:hypothetical protein